MRAFRRFLVLTFACTLFSCASSLRQAVDYRGDAFAPRTRPSGLASVAVLPLDFERFGSLTARCTMTPLGGSLEGAWLSDVDCTERRLRAALRQKAAEVGAELLVGERCHSTSVSRRSPQRGLRCMAQAARPDEESRAKRPLSAQPTHAASAFADADEAASLDDPTGDQAWRIEIRYEPSSDAAPRDPRPPDAVGELPSLPVSHVSLGLITSRCEAQCSVDAVRAALRVTAGRLGASDVAGVSCVEHPPGITCMATAAEPEVEL